jgi:hypothetical protein
MNVENIKVDPMIVIYGEDKFQVEKVVFSPALVKADLAAKYFHTYTTSTLGVITKRVFWFKTQVGDLAPTLPDATLYEVDISGAGIDTVAEFATELAAEMALVVAAFSAAVATNNEVVFTHAVKGYAPAAHDAKNPAKVTKLGLQLITQGEVEAEIGAVEGTIAVKFKETFIDVKAHETGTTMIAQLKTGVEGVEVSLAMLETVKAKLKAVLSKSNNSFIPDNGTELFGMGTYKNFENMFKYASKLRLHPKRLLAGDKSEDINFPKAMPNLEGIDFSGEEVLKLPVMFKVYPNLDIDSRICYWFVGDGSQTLT